jgi:hypothetical protein
MRRVCDSRPAAGPLGLRSEGELRDSIGPRLTRSARVSHPVPETAIGGPVIAPPKSIIGV